jgi:hypothetical protein
MWECGRQRVTNDLYRARLFHGRIIWLHAPPPLRQLARPAILRKTEKERDKMLRGGGGAGAESYDRKKARSSKNNSILSGGREPSSQDLAQCRVITCESTKKVDKQQFWIGELCLSICIC